MNVIMVSDTHDPGFAPATSEGRREVGFQELLAIQPTYAQLKAMVEEQQLVASFRVHAIAPRSDCSEPWIEDLDPAYFDVAEASGGVMADICDVDDYSEVIRSIVSRGAEIQTGVFPLSVGRGKATVDAVLIGDQEVPWTLSPSGRTVVVETDLTGRRDALRIRYALDDLRMRRIREQPLPARSDQAR